MSSFQSAFKMPKFPSLNYPSEVDGLDVGSTLVVQEKVDGANCLPYNQRIQTEEGAVRIGAVVNQQMDVKALSYNKERGEMEYKPITGYFKNGKADSWIKIEFDGVCSSHVVTTPEHEVYLKSGKKEAQNVCSGDKMVTRRPSVSGENEEMLVGSVLGDASIEQRKKSKRSILSETHGENQHEYLRFKERVLGDVVSNTYTERSAYDEDHRETEKLSLTTKSLEGIDELGQRFYDGDKLVPEDISLSDRAIAILYCDDGSTDYNDFQRPRATFHTQSFTEEGATRLKEEMGYSGRVVDYGNGPVIELYTEASENLFSDIAEFVPECMSYKIPDKFWTEKNSWSADGPERFCATVTSVEECEQASDQRYDIEVKDNHNYVTKDVVVSNCRLSRETHLDDEYHIEGREIVFGSRNVVWKNEKDVANAFDDHPETGESALECVRENVNMRVWKNLEAKEGPFVVYGEAMHPHTLDYDYGRTPRFLAFDIYVVERGEFLPPSNFDWWIGQLNLPRVPHVGTFQNLDEIAVPQSQFRDGKAEGVVIKNPETGARAKLVTDEFKEKHGGPSPSTTERSDTQTVVDSIVTDARIEKTAYKLVDRGQWDGLQMPMMEDLPEAVIRDALSEEAGNVVMNNNYKLDTAEFRSEASSKCARVLRSVLQGQER